MPTQQSPSLTDFQGAPFDTAKLETELLTIRQAAMQLGASPGYTTRELAVLTGKSHKQAAAFTRTAIEAGLMEMSGKRPVPSMDGSIRLVPVYRLVPKG